MLSWFHVGLCKHKMGLEGGPKQKVEQRANKRRVNIK